MPGLDLDDVETVHVDSIHDLGGKRGFGQVAPADEPLGFRERWHAKVFNMVMGVGGKAFDSVDQFRHAIERIDPVSYLTHGYYGRWLGGLETLLIESGLLSAEEIHARVTELDPHPQPASARPRSVPPASVSGAAGAKHVASKAPAFERGQIVRTRSTPSAGHTRLPAYARGKRGRVVAQHGGWVLPDASAHGEHRSEQLYTVAFPGVELWGDSGEPDLSVRLDLFESYLEKESE